MPADNVLEGLFEGKLPKSLRIAAARGLVPVPPNKMLLLLVRLARDSDPEIAQQALQTLETWPDKDVAAQLAARECSPEVI